ncbi:hypothetical protein EI94DRAFT_1699336 [Lactarius quietus]|nr:hypothetical protein EI94DRAFT_1699336 [Lactarius quietus]
MSDAMRYQMTLMVQKYSTQHSDLLHQLIKGVFKDHIVKWVIAISAVPTFPGLRWFVDGHDFKQWMGDDSKALMKVFLAAIASYVPCAMVCCVAVFMDACYIACWNAINSTSLKYFQECVEAYHELCVIFVETGMLRTLEHMDKMMALCQHLEAGGFLQGFGFPFLSTHVNTSDSVPTLEESEETEDEDVAGVLGNCKDVSKFDIQLTTTPQCDYPPGLLVLAAHTKQPKFLLIFAKFLSKMLHPDKPTASSMLAEYPTFDGAIKVHHSATATFYAPSDLSGSGGLRHELIRLMLSFYGHPRCDTVFIVTDDSQPGMDSMEIGHILLHEGHTFY